MSAELIQGLLSEQEQGELLVGLLADADSRYRDDPWAWLCEQVWTVDEASGARARWPAEKGYLQELIDAMTREPMLAIPKSRRMMVTWAAAGWVTHRIRYYPHNAIFWQSQTEEKAAFVIDQRCTFIEDNLDVPALRRRRVDGKEPEGEEYRVVRTSRGLIGKLSYGRTKSYAWAVAEGADVFRSYTPTKLVMDESEFQDRARESLVAAIPLVEKGAGIMLISSSNGPRGVIAEECRELGFVRFAQ